METSTPREQELEAQLKRYVMILWHTRVFIDSQYLNLGKKTIPLHNAMEDAWASLTTEDQAFNRSVLRENGVNG